MVLLLSVTSAFSQKWKTVSYKQFKQEYTRLLAAQPEEMYSVQIKTLIFSGTTQAEPKVTQDAVLSVYKQNQYSFVSGATIQLQRNNLKLDIDTDEKQVVLSKGVDSQLMGYKPGQFDNIDSTRYRFYAMSGAKGISLRVEEIKPVSSMQLVSFSFDKTTNKIMQLEMIYWPSNFEYESLDDATLEQPKIRMDYSNYQLITSEEPLTNNFNKWLSKDTQTGIYSCPESAFTFYDLLDKK